jgi:hypothetical protein
VSDMFHILSILLICFVNYISFSYFNYSLLHCNLLSHKSLNITVKVGDYVDYFEPNSVVGDTYKLHNGQITKIYPRDDLHVMSDTHLVIGLDPITYGRPIRFPSVTGDWLNTDSADINFIVGDLEGGSTTRRYSDKYKRIVKEARASFDNVRVNDNPEGDVSPEVSYISTIHEFIFIQFIVTDFIVAEFIHLTRRGNRRRKRIRRNIIRLMQLTNYQVIQRGRRVSLRILAVRSFTIGKKTR